MNSFFYRKLLSIDQFAQPFNLRLKRDGDQTQASFTGAICSILMFCIVATYSVMKINHLFDKKAVDIMQAVQESHFKDTD